MLYLPDMTTRKISRRAILAGATASLARPLWANPGFGPALARARSLEQLRAIVIAQHGRIVDAEAFRGPRLDRPANIKSVSKTLVAALTGAAIDAGHLPGPTARLGDVAPSLIPDRADPRVADITIADLVTMQAGLERTSGANYGAWVSSRDWVADALSRPFVAEPGSRMLYSTGSFHILGAVLSEVTGRSLLQLARENLGTPLDVAFSPWVRDPQGRYLGGNDMAMTPTDLVQIGELYRNGGTHNGVRVLSEDWVTASWTPRTRSFWSGHAYGYGWFLAKSGGHDIAYGRGYGGQMLYVVPSLALTVVVTSDPNRPARSDGHVGDLNAMLAETILPAAEAMM